MEAISGHGSFESLWNHLELGTSRKLKETIKMKKHKLNSKTGRDLQLGDRRKWIQSCRCFGWIAEDGDKKLGLWHC